MTITIPELSLVALIGPTGSTGSSSPADPCRCGGQRKRQTWL